MLMTSVYTSLIDVRPPPHAMCIYPICANCNLNWLGILRSVLLFLGITKKKQRKIFFNTYHVVY